MSEPQLLSIKVARTETMLTVIGIPDVPGIAAALFKALGREGTPVTMIVQNAPDAGSASITFTVTKEYSERAMTLARDLAESLGAEGIMKDSHIARISIDGVGVEGAAGVAGEFFSTLAEKSINVLAINTAAHTISVVIEDSATQRAVDLLCQKFSLKIDQTD